MGGSHLLSYKYCFWNDVSWLKHEVVHLWEKNKDCISSKIWYYSISYKTCHESLVHFLTRSVVQTLTEFVEMVFLTMVLKVILEEFFFSLLHLTF